MNLGRSGSKTDESSALNVAASEATSVADGRGVATPTTLPRTSTSQHHQGRRPVTSHQRSEFFQLPKRSGEIVLFSRAATQALRGDGDISEGTALVGDGGVSWGCP